MVKNQMKMIYQKYILTSKLITLSNLENYVLKRGIMTINKTESDRILM